MNDTVDVVDQGRTLRFGFDDLLRYHGPEAPGGVAHAFVVMRRAWPLLDPDRPPERREIQLHTAFPGPGARDGIELVTRAVTGDRYVVDPALGRPDRGTTLERYVFVLGYRGRTVRLEIRPGFVVDEFIALSRKPGRSAEEEEHLTVLKQEMADRLLAPPPDQVYDVVEPS